MTRHEIAKAVLNERWHAMPAQASSEAFAPSNIALCKYWGKRNQEINLPVTSSLSISLGHKGATTKLSLIDAQFDEIILNDKPLDYHSPFSQRLVGFLDLFRAKHMPRFRVRTSTNLPVAAGLASSACGFASLALALDSLFAWELDQHQLSILARLGSGSACRSIWDGFVEWHMGVREDGMDSHGMFIPEQWPEVCVGLLILTDQAKPMSSREAMQRTVTTSALYSSWSAKVSRDLFSLKQAISVHDFLLLGKTAESNAMAMHATMLSAWPPITYFIPETLLTMQKIWALRKEGISLYFTQDAGPNLKLLFLEKDKPVIESHFPTIETIHPFAAK